MEEYPEIESHYQFQAEPPVTLHLQELPPASLQIIFKFSCSVLVCTWIENQDSAPMGTLDQNELLSTETDLIAVDREQFLSYKKAQEIIREELVKHWSIWAEAHDELIKFALETARRAFISMPPCHNVVYVNIHITENLIKFFFRDSIDGAVQHSMEVDEVGMIPADYSSMEALEKRKIIALTDCESCTICLEEFLEGCEAVRMPCEHFFHENCIKKWLSFSHYCPVCRFEMPTV